MTRFPPSLFPSLINPVAIYVFPLLLREISFWSHFVPIVLPLSVCRLLCLPSTIKSPQILRFPLRRNSKCFFGQPMRCSWSVTFSSLANSFFFLNYFPADLIPRDKGFLLICAFHPPSPDCRFFFSQGVMCSRRLFLHTNQTSFRTRPAHFFLTNGLLSVPFLVRSDAGPNLLIN